MSRTRSAARGLSKFELLAALIAVAGGMWIGANYVGLDLNQTAYDALDDTELLGKIPEDWRPPNPECPDGDCPSEEEIRQGQLDDLREQLDGLREEVNLITGGVEPLPQGESTLTAELRTKRDRTLPYWNTLREIVTEVTTLQQRVASFQDPEKYARALSVRRRAMDYGLDAVKLLDDEGVDPQAVEAAGRVSEWFQHGAETIGSAVEIRSRQQIGGRSVTGVELWRSLEADLAKRTELVRRKTRETAGYLSSRYFTEFTPLDL